ncbi:PREDICTED: uncharacterized protein LOC105557524 [Vollenhovia emeryi]|uniref:uncharacterized protein LOC105557524 n=1 Tax=Vollenhovia emeryi TaxID=411798 RepID=UPI0005F4D523|nr:PREDICTED: uncharacterized protein LOC105557524 [Vollenhovia emeryi]
MELPTMRKENVSELRQIADGASKHVHALRALNRPTAHWDDLLQLTDFISHRCQVIEVTSNVNATSTKNTSARAGGKEKRQARVATLKFKWSYCKGDHFIYQCKELLNLPVSSRQAEIRKLKICLNCLRSASHAANKYSSGACRICKSKHNTLLHVTTPTEAITSVQEAPEKQASPASPAALVTHLSCPGDGRYAMLSTPCRVLLDCGSQANFVSRKFLHALKLKLRSLNISISGINCATSRATQTVRLRMQSRLNAFSFDVECIVTDQVTDKLPSFTIKRSDFNLPRNLRLADPQFNISADVDALIGADLFWDLICVGQVKASQYRSTLQKTRLGWILAGRLGNPTTSSQRIRSFHATVTNVKLHEQLSKFWRQEDIGGRSTSYTIEESLCERHFLENVSQTPSGRYMVKLSIKESAIAKLGDSENIARKRLQALEKRFKRESTLRRRYEHFIQEYATLGHMKLAFPHSNEGPSCYLPHHCVFKAAGPSSKLRVVFDASCKTSTGFSLNDALMVGPAVQQDLMSILLRFRIGMSSQPT